MSEAAFDFDAARFFNVCAGLRQVHGTLEALVDGVRCVPMADNVRDALTQAIVHSRNALKLKVMLLPRHNSYSSSEPGVCRLRSARSARHLRSSKAVFIGSSRCSNAHQFGRMQSSISPRANLVACLSARF